MIFSAGLGTRFKPWTDTHPKALAPVNGKPLLQWNIEYLKSHDIDEVIVNVHHFPDQIISAVKDNNGWGSHVIISDERNELLETGGGLMFAKKLFNAGEKFITCNVDILTDLDISRLKGFHESRKPLISFGVTNRKTSRYLLLDQDMVLCGWRNTNTGEEKIVRKGTQLKEWAYSCVVIFEYDVFELCPFKGKFSLMDLYLHLAANHKIMGFDHSGDRFVDVGKPDSVAKAEAMFG